MTDTGAVLLVLAAVLAFTTGHWVAGIVIVGLSALFAYGK